MRINIDNSKIFKANSTVVLGVLAQNEESFPDIGYERANVTIMKNSSSVAFFVKPLSDESKYIEDNLNKYLPSGSTYIGLESGNASVFPSNFKLFSPDVKISRTTELLENKLILFKPYIYSNGDRVFKNITILGLLDDTRDSEDSKYSTICKLDCTNKQLDTAILSNTPIYIKNTANIDLEEIDYILCGDYIYGVVDSAKKSNTGLSSWIFEGEDIRKYKIDKTDDSFKIKTIDTDTGIVFMEKKYLEKLDNLIIEEGEILSYSIDDTACTSIEPVETCLNQNNTISQYNSLEDKFINSFKSNTLKNKLFYSSKDLINFHTSLKTNALTIVAGMSGTGKTQIAKIYAETLGATIENQRLLFLPISPTYTEPQDLLGYLNTNTGIYTPSDTKFVKLLSEAEQNPNEMHVVIFDEMNLSQVEHWFAPFISLLELTAENRFISLYSSDSVCHNKHLYRSEINIGENVLFIGTVNLDETTKDFSDRVLDRANLITLEKIRFADIFKENINPNKEEKPLLLNETISFNDFETWIDTTSGVSNFTLTELEFLDNLHNLLQEHDNQKGVSFRLLDRVGNYLTNIPLNSDNIAYISRRDAIDISLKQRLLTKIKGSSKQLDGLLCEESFELTENSPLYNFFDSEEAQMISDFVCVKKQIKLKEKELKCYGYTN